MINQFNYLYLGLYAAFMSVCIVVLIIGLVKPYKIRRNVNFLLLCFFVVGWFYSELVGRVSGDATIYGIAFSVGLGFLGLASATIFFFTISFYKLPIMPPLPVRLLIYAFPVLSMISAFFPTFHAMICDFSQIPTSMPEIIQCLGPWFWVHIIYSYVFMIISIGIVMYGHMFIPNFYRFPSILVVTAVCFIPIVHVLTFTGLWTMSVPPFALTFCAAIVLTNFALANNDENIFIRYARGSVFQYLNEYVLVLGKNGRVVDSNPGATALFKSHGINPTAGTLGDIIDSLVMKGAVIKAGPDGVLSTDISITSGEFPLILNYRIHEISDKKKQMIGSIVIFTDVTGNRAFLDMLEERAGMDPLTGLANRTAYLGARNRLDTSEYLPLSVIICDINGLKTVNDSLGHKYGDRMIQEIAEVLESMCPKSGFLARIGGDEFILLLPQTDEQASNLLINQIRKEFQLKSKESAYNLSAALGAAVKHSMEQDLDEIIDQADSLMYKDKSESKINKN